MNIENKKREHIEKPSLTNWRDVLQLKQTDPEFKRSQLRCYYLLQQLQQFSNKTNLAGKISPKMSVFTILDLLGKLDISSFNLIYKEKFAWKNQALALVHRTNFGVYIPIQNFNELSLEIKKFDANKIITLEEIIIERYTPSTNKTTTTPTYFESMMRDVLNIELNESQLKSIQDYNDKNPDATVKQIKKFLETLQ